MVLHVMYFKYRASKRKSVRRRDYIIFTMALLVGSLFGLVSFLVGSYFWPPRKTLKGQVRVEGWLPIADPHRMPSGSSKTFSYGSIPGVLIRDRGEMRAFSRLCSHLGCALIWHPDRKIFSCPCHGGEFDSGGKAIAGPPGEPLNQFAIQIRDDRIYVKPAWLT